MMIAMLFVMTACDQATTNSDTYDNYSVGLNDDGFYENMEQDENEIPDFNSMSFTVEQILDWGYNHSKEIGETDCENVNDYVYSYGEEFLGVLGLVSKETAENGDIVSITLNFYQDDKLMEGYSSTRNYSVDSDGDAIVSSLVGHKVGETYEIEYTFSEEDTEHASEQATVEITINSISIAKPIEAGIVEENIDEISKYLTNVTDVKSYLKALRPQLALATIDLFVENYLQNAEDFVVPEEYIEYEVYRLKFRLQQINYNYEDYLAAVQMTDEEVREYCTMVAKENYICMLICQQNGISVTDENIDEFYGSNREYITEVQGLPYMKLNVMRQFAIEEVASRIKLMDGDVNINESITVSESVTENTESVESAVSESSENE